MKSVRGTRAGVVKSAVHEVAKRGLFNVGAHCRQERIAGLRKIASYVELGHWVRSGDYAMPPGPRPRDRWPVLDVALADVGGQRPLYLEFGVYKGASLRYCANQISDADARFIGFDSFQGLPDTWRHDVPRGEFSLNAQAPQINDARVTFVTGWFEDTLPSLNLPDHDRLMVNVDADLYSSARVILTYIEPHLQPGTYLYFDEFNDSGNELRAFWEFVERTGRQFEIVEVSRCWSHWLFRCT